MKVLSLLQPWASLVVLGHKKIETRGWTTAYRGPLLLHASLGKSGKNFALFPEIQQYIPDFSALPFGAIIGEVFLADVVRFAGADDDFLQSITLEERAFGDFATGRYGFVLKDAVAFEEPIPAKGKLGLWEW